MSDATYPDAACQDAEDIMYIDSDHGIQQLSFVGGQTWMIAHRPSTELTWAAQRGNHTHMCPHCGITLLTGEYAGFCCGKNGSRLNDVQELPALPPEYAALKPSMGAPMGRPAPKPMGQRLHQDHTRTHMGISHGSTQTHGSQTHGLWVYLWVFMYLLGKHL